MKTTLPHHRRRGALLLLVLGVLTLFVLLGTMTMTLATRARTTSRAFAAATTGKAVGPMLARAELEDAILLLLRGGTSANGVSESILGDMYGTTPSLSGTATTIAQGDALTTLTIVLDQPRSASGGPLRPGDLGGRVITLIPAADKGGRPVSYRILQARFGSGTSSTSGTAVIADSTTPVTCFISPLLTDPGALMPQPPCRVLINPPAFREETYDAYDDRNAWLTRVTLEDGRVASVPRPAFSGTSRTIVVDNDNDGVKDGVWLTGILPSRPAPSGGRFEFDASFLVLDLDGRINVNAHGSRTSIDFPSSDPKSSNGWQSAPPGPIGSGWGPADVDASRVFVDAASPPPSWLDGKDPPPVASDRWRRIIGDRRVSSLTGTTPTPDQRRPVPMLGEVDGRYGPDAYPGVSGTSESISRRNERLFTTGTSGTSLSGTTEAVVDLKWMVKATVETGSDSAMPQLSYYCPDWTKAGFVDDPYELRLDTSAPRPFVTSGATAQADNPFTLADLETVLRQFDVDAHTTSPRLAIALDSFSQRTRMLLTTDSWDTPMLTGTIADAINAYVGTMSCDPATVMSPDVLAGLRFDINRPLATGTAELASKQDYCKHLYALLVALGQPAGRETAQWAANVVDYRDPDSDFTRFQFDTTPADGWNQSRTVSGTTSVDPGWSDSNVVWGVERPELLIAQTIAFYVQDNSTTSGTTTTSGTIQDALYVSLYRPSWESVRRDASNQVVTTKANSVDLATKGTKGDPIWRLRFEPGKTVRFDKPGSNDKEVAGVFRNTGGGDATIDPGCYLVVRPEDYKSTGKKTFDTSLIQTPPISDPSNKLFKQFIVNQGGVFKAEQVPASASVYSGADSIMYLERLERPDAPFDDVPTSPTYNPYVTLDQLGIKRVNRTGNNANNWKAFFRNDPIWKNGPFDHMDEPGIVPLTPAQKSWLPWANRPFISQAELLTVPKGGGPWMLWDYGRPKDKRATNPYYCLPDPKILEATIVPSRFVGSQVSVASSSLSALRMDAIPHNQLSRYREPGRVNLNTVVPNRNCTIPEHNDATWSAAVGDDATVSLDDFRNAGSATTVCDLLSLMQGGGVYLDASAAPGTNGNSWKKNRDYDANPTAAYATAIRLANVATVRSHLFAVWVTLRIRNTSVDGIDSFHRAFAIIDRSQPVGYREGQDLNVRDTVRLLRFLE